MKILLAGVAVVLMLLCTISVFAEEQTIVLGDGSTVKYDDDKVEYGRTRSGYQYLQQRPPRQDEQGRDIPNAEERPRGTTTKHQS